MRQEHSRYFCELKVPINDQLNGVMTWLDWNYGFMEA